MWTEQQLRDLLVGQEVECMKGTSLVLKNGTILDMYESEQDCCAHAAGEWEIIGSEDFHGGITDLEYEVVKKEGEEYDSEPSYLTVTLLHNQNPVAKANGYSDMGNGGYYFSVLNLKVRLPNGEVVDEPILRSR